MGDNRDNSLDSRADVGQVPYENLVGRADILFFSHEGSSPWWKFWTWPSTIRFGRIGDAIESAADQAGFAKRPATGAVATAGTAGLPFTQLGAARTPAHASVPFRRTSHS